MHPYFLSFVFSVFLFISLLAGVQFALSFWSAGALHSLLVGIISAILLIWDLGAIVVFHSFQDGKKLSWKETIKNAGLSLLWPAFLIVPAAISIRELLGRDNG